MTAENEKYFAAAMKVASSILRTRDNALDWWAEEEEHRKLHNVTKEQQAELLKILAKRFPKPS